MKKMVVIYKAPPDADAFMAYYRSKHAPLVRQIPGLVKLEATLINRTLLGEQGNFLLSEMYFADADSFRSAMKSPENAATGADLANFAPGLATVMTGEMIDL